MILSRAPLGRSIGMAAALALLLLLGAGCAAVEHPVPPASAVITEPVALDGWFHTVWNGSARHYLVDAGGGSVELLLAEELLDTPGGSMAFDRRHVTVTGRWVDETGHRFAVDAIRHSLPESHR